ncbi:glycosyl transferase [Thermaurantimonas aggregans]|uniref:Glycosyl transferase n=1 Tax=Thermaurantimonas aggregans TaxID=2173829 RepID=A0A401XK03_9FLAO|nr:glycosyltransferase [Thermaurantimonas aggregans]GCD77349.1 glycosyl transferase [Thermaurantimonas aggregans]
MEYDKPLVSICMITYNHEPYIREAIEGVLKQITNFDFELIIGEDCSTDRTREICLEYQRKNPDVIRLLLREKNIGMMPNFLQTLEACQGKYIALCEGDDYWTDPLKLQKQVDFLEAHPDFVGAFHDCIILNQADGSQRLRIGLTHIDEEADMASIIRQKNSPTASLLFKNCFSKDFWPQNADQISQGDYLLVVLLARYGKFKYFPEPMSLYRIHEGGVWSSKTRLYTTEQDIKFYTYLYQLFDTSEIRQVIDAKLKAAYHKYAIELVKAGSIIKSISFLKKALQNNLTGQTNQKRILSTYLIVLASKTKQVFFPFLPSFSSIKNTIKK